MKVLVLKCEYFLRVKEQETLRKHFMRQVNTGATFITPGIEYEVVDVDAATFTGAWIPTKEMNPPKPEDCEWQGYLVCKKGVWEPFIAEWNGWSWRDDDCNGWRTVTDIVAWMPLPKRYDEKQWMPLKK